MQEEIRPPRPEERAAFLAIAAEYLPGIPPARFLRQRYNSRPRP